MKPFIQTSLWSKRICFALLFFVIIMTKPAAVFGQVASNCEIFSDAVNFITAVDCIVPINVSYILTLTIPAKVSFKLGYSPLL